MVTVENKQSSMQIIRVGPHFNLAMTRKVTQLTSNNQLSRWLKMFERPYSSYIQSYIQK